MNIKLTLALSLLMGGISLTVGAQTPAPAATSPQVKPNQRCDFESASGFVDGSKKSNPALPAGYMRLNCLKPVDTSFSAVCNVFKMKELKPNELILSCNFNPQAK